MSDERPSVDAPDGVAIESASSDDRLDVLRVLDAAMLETDAETVDGAIGDTAVDDTAVDDDDETVDDASDPGDALVARFNRTGAVVGALVATRPEPARLHVDAVAVRRARRGRGIGSALVAEAVRRAAGDAAIDAVTASFDPELKGFYTDLGFEIDRGGDTREIDGEAAEGADPEDDAGGADQLRGRCPV